MTKTIGRRSLLAGLGTFPLVAIVSSPVLIAACGKGAEAPLAHLHGKDWVHGAYKLYSSRYASVQSAAETSSQNAYRILAQKGVVALHQLQKREVPFFIKVDEDASAFRMQRKVPERLTFTADMDEAGRRAAEANWMRAREHIHTDYEEIRRLDWAMTRLLAQLQRIRTAIEEGRVEQYRLTEQLVDLRKDPGKVPYELPKDVSAKDYEEILLLLVERIEDDRKRLGMIEADIVAVGLVVRSTDANSATLAASIRKVLLAIEVDGATPVRPPEFPAEETARQKLVTTGRALAKDIEGSKEFAKWKADEREKKLAALGAFLSVLDATTGLPTSRVYRTVLDIWRGDDDYLSYLTTLAALLPHGGEVTKVLTTAIEYSEKARAVSGAVMSIAREGKGKARELVIQEATDRAKGVVLNTASRFAIERANKQLSFFKDSAEVDAVAERLAETDLVKGLLPDITKN